MFDGGGMQFNGVASKLLVWSCIDDVLLFLEVLISATFIFISFVHNIFIYHLLIIYLFIYICILL